MRILIIKASALGDIIHALPVLDYLQQVEPGVEIDWVVEEPFRDILEGHPQLSQLHVVRTRAWRKAPLAARTRQEIAKLRATLRGRRYDLVFDIQGNIKSGLIARLTGTRDLIGFSWKSVREKPNLLFTTRHLPMQHQDYHATDKYLRLVSTHFDRDFSDMDLTTTIATDPEDDAAADALLKSLGDGRVFLFHCGTSWQTKLWAEDLWIELGRELLTIFPAASFLLSWGSEKEQQTATTVAKGIGISAQVLKRHRLKGLAALMKRVDLVVAPDTGPVHIAAAVNTPTVSFFRSTDGKRTGPRGKRNMTIQSPLSCTRCARKECIRDRECQHSIKVKTMVQAISENLEMT